jgi:hypothetical protein
MSLKAYAGNGVRFSDCVGTVYLQCDFEERNGINQDLLSSEER